MHKLAVKNCLIHRSLILGILFLKTASQDPLCNKVLKERRCIILIARLLLFVCCGRGLDSSAGGARLLIAFLMECAWKNLSRWLILKSFSIWLKGMKVLAPQNEPQDSPQQLQISYFTAASLGLMLKLRLMNGVFSTVASYPLEWALFSK